MKHFIALCCALITASVYSAEDSFIISDVIIYDKKIIMAPMIIMDDADDKPNDIKPRIINGKEASSMKNSPYIAKIVLKSGRLSKSGKPIYYTCGASVIAPNWLLTAAHCIQTPWDGYAFVGCLNWKNQTGSCINITLKAEYYYRHPFFYASMNGVVNDIGLIYLPQPLTYSENVGEISLNTNKYIRPNQLVDISGYGVTENGTPSDTLKYTTERTIANRECRNIFPEVKRSEICYKPNRSGSCHGDSGGPMTMNVNSEVVLVGVASFGGPTCHKYPGVYTRISSYQTWLCEMTRCVLNYCHDQCSFWKNIFTGPLYYF